MKYVRADLLKRFLAFLVDVILAAGFFIIPFPLIGSLIAAGYFLTRDYIIFAITGNQDWKNQSLGKRVFGLEVLIQVSPGKYKNMDLTATIKRNIIPAAGFMIGIIPLLGWVLAPIISLIVWLVEFITLMANPENDRLGDRLATTQVLLRLPNQ